MSESTLDIQDRQQSFDLLNKVVKRAEFGIRAVSIMYDEHSDDQFAKDNIYRLKDNIFYRLQLILIQYRILIQEFYRNEHYLNELNEKEPGALFSQGFNPHLHSTTLDITSVFDGIIFQIVSVFDYFSHYISYVILKNKQNTLYWTKLAKASYGKDNEISKLQIKEVIKTADNKFIGRLYDYRSNLIHNKLDSPISIVSIPMGEKGQVVLKTSISNDLQKKFKSYFNDSTIKNITVLYFTEFLINETSTIIESVLSGLVVEIKSQSHYSQNLASRKKLMIGHLDPETKTFMRISDKFWSDYLNNKVE